MAEVGKYYVTIMPDMSKFAGAVKSGASGAGGIASGIGRIFTTGIGVALGNALTSGFSAFMGSLDQGISRIDTINAFPRVMQNIGVDAASSSRAIDMLVKAVDGMPTTLDAAVAATQRFTLANGDVERSAQMFDALNNALLGGGQSAEAQAQALEQISQAYAKGKPDYREWLSMQQNMGPALKMVASAWGMTTEEMSAALKDGDRSMDDFFDTLITLNDEGIDGMASLSEQADVSMANIGTAVANLKNRFAQSWGFIIDEIGQENIANAINGFSSTFRDAFKYQIAPAIGDAYEGLKAFFSGAQTAPEELGPLGSAAFDAASFVGGLGQSFMDGFGPTDEFNALIRDSVQGTLDNLAQSAEDAAPYLNDMAESFGAFAAEVTPDLVDGLGGVVSFLGSLAPLAAACATFLAEMGRMVAFLGEKLGEGFGWATDKLMDFDSWVAEQLPEDFHGMSEAHAREMGIIGNNLDIYRQKGTSASDAVGVSFQHSSSNISTSMSAGLREVGNKLSSVKTEGEKSASGIETAFSGLGSRITKSMGGINFPKPHINWKTSTKNGASISLPEVDWFAKGGFVKGSQIIGVGEAGTELIWPSYGDSLDKYGAAIASHMEGATNEDIIWWLSNNLGPIINEYAPRTTKREMSRVLTGGQVYA